MTITTLDFLRHGEPEGGRKYRGQVDDPLSAKGWEEMRRATAGERPWQALVSSPLSRCRAFAQTLAEELALPLALDERLKEVGFGAWEGRTGTDIRAGAPDLLFDFKRDPLGFRPAGAEPLDAFAGRVAAAFDDLVNAYAGSHILVVAHAGVIRMVLCHVLGMPATQAYRIQVGSAAKARVRVEQRGDGPISRRLDQLLWLDAGQGGGE